MRRALFISTGLMLVFGLVLVGVYWDTFSLMAQNMAAMGEGKDLAEAIRGPDDLLTYIAGHPEGLSLVAFDLGQEEQGIFYGADVSRPIMGLTRLLVLAEYVRQVEHGIVDPASRISLDTLAAYHLPGTDQGAHASAMQQLALHGYIDRDSTVAVEHMAEAMMAWNSSAATDLLQDRLGRAHIDSLPARIGLATLDAPLPGNGLFLSWNNHTLALPSEKRMAMLHDEEPSAYAEEVYRLAKTFRYDSTFRAKEVARLTDRGTDLHLLQQRNLAQATLPRGTARAYAQLLTQALADSLLTPGISRRFVSHLERPLRDSVRTIFQAVGSKAGSFPGIISFVGYARRNEVPLTRVVALLMEDVPISVFYHLMQTGIDKGFEIQLLADDVFFNEVRTRLIESDGSIRLDDGALRAAR